MMDVDGEWVEEDHAPPNVSARELLQRRLDG